jgi:3-deoxy-D-manno-octulosonic-acid transferase
MSAIALKSDIAERDYDVRFVQKRTHAPQQNELLFDHVVSAGDASAILRLIRSLHFAAFRHPPAPSASCASLADLSRRGRWPSDAGLNF